MRVLTIIDLTVYLLAGVVIILYADHLRQSWRTKDDAAKKRTVAQRVGIVALAVLVGALACGGRYFINRIGKSSALQQLSATFEKPAPAVMVV